MDRPLRREGLRETCTRADAQLKFFADHVGSKIPGAEEGAKRLAEKAAELQHICGSHGRVHVIFESAAGALHNSQIPVSQFNFPQLMHSLVCVLFSPTIVFSGDHRVIAASQLVSALSAFSFLFTATSPTAEIHSAAPPPTNPVPIQRKNTPVPPPKWFPGGRYTSGPQSSDQVLQVSDEAFHRFATLSGEQTHSLYMQFFQKMYYCIKGQSNGGVKGPLRYEMFTPPWIRKRIRLGDKITILEDAAIPLLRRQRNVVGYQRLKLILAAFYERERIGRHLIDDMLPDFLRQTFDSQENDQSIFAGDTPVTHLPSGQDTTSKSNPTPERHPIPDEVPNENEGNADDILPENNSSAVASEYVSSEFQGNAYPPTRDRVLKRPRTDMASQQFQTNASGRMNGFNAQRSASSVGAPGATDSNGMSRVAAADQMVQTGTGDLVAHAGIGQQETGVSGEMASTSERLGRLTPTTDMSGHTARRNAQRPARRLSSEVMGGSEIRMNGVIHVVGGQHNGHGMAFDVRCGAGEQCRLRMDAAAQTVEGITGKCRRCGIGMHEHCGGREGGAMLCGGSRCSRIAR